MGYITEKIGDDYKWWGKSKQIILAPTGSGKTTLVVNTLVPYYRKMGKRVLILVNRKSLLRQYIYEMALKTEHYETGVDILTYQEYAGRIKNSGMIMGNFDEYDLVVFDEIHFFISDADFNSNDTYIVWQAILHSYGRCMVFMTATPDEMMPFLEEYEKLVKKYHNNRFENASEFNYYEVKANYDYIEPVIMPDKESLLKDFALSKKKSIIFLNDIEKAKTMKTRIQEINSKKRVICINAESMDSLNPEERTVTKALYMANRVDCDILITTSVLDNGVSIHDPDVENIAIFTDSKSSFLQMLGRVRTERIESLKLFLVPQSTEYWERRERVLEEEVKEIERLTEKDQFTRECDFLCEAFLEDSKFMNLYKKLFVLVPNHKDFPIYDGVESALPRAKGVYPHDKVLVINRLAVAKIRQQLHIIRRMHKLSMRGVEQPCYEQFSWLGKEPEDITYQSSTYLEQEKAALLLKFQEVKEFEKKEFTEWKLEVGKRFRKSCLREYNIRSGSPISEDALKEILESVGLKLDIGKDENRRNIYTIKEK